MKLNNQNELEFIKSLNIKEEYKGELHNMIIWLSETAIDDKYNSAFIPSNRILYNIQYSFKKLFEYYKIGIKETTEEFEIDDNFKIYQYTYEIYKIKDSLVNKFINFFTVYK